MENFRIGQGYDIHKLVEGRPLILGGVKIESKLGALGHSDADTLLHAITDAILGAAALGDIGTHFPPTNPEFADIDSSILLKKTCLLLKEAGYRLGNIDSSIILEKPKLAPHIRAMRVKLAQITELSPEKISVKAKTKEGQDATGQLQAVEAQAVVLIFPAIT
jgi:2-C-methyl-D-erythritol 2,4-cyclodiphosphate synthase